MYIYTQFEISIYLLVINDMLHVHADVTNVFPPDEEDVANIFNTLRGMCTRKAVCINFMRFFSYMYISCLKHARTH